jgi:hypothetical protein
MNRTTATSGGLAVAITTVLAWAMREGAGVEIPGEVTAAISAIIGWGIAWWTPAPQEPKA